MLCDLVSLKDLDIRGEEVGICMKEAFFMIELNGIVLEEVIHAPIHGWQGDTERQKVAGDTIIGLPLKCLKATALSSMALFPFISCNCSSLFMRILKY